MYIPKAFQEDRVDHLHKLMREIGAATVVSQGADGLIASHVPVELQSSPAPNGTVFCHFARPNPHARAIAEGGEVLLIFQGPQSYISPSWYPSKHQTGKAVPTWNYVAIHAYGRGRLFEETEELRRHLAALSDHFEAPYAMPWKLADAPDDYIAAMCKGIIGVEIELSRIEGKKKLSQNKKDADRLGTINGLKAQGDPASLTVAELMEAEA